MISGTMIKKNIIFKIILKFNRFFLNLNCTFNSSMNFYEIKLNSSVAIAIKLNSSTF